MNFKKLLSIALCAVILFTALPFCANAEEYSGEYADGEVIFRYKETISADGIFCSNQNIPDELAEIGITSVKEMPVGKIYDTSIKTNPDGTKTKEGCFVGYFEGDVEETCKKLEAVSGVISASPNSLFEKDAITMPTEITSPTNLYTTYTKWWMDDLVDIPDAWTEFDTLGKGVVIAVLDSGFSIKNPEFTGRIWEDANGNKGYNAVTYTNDVTPDDGHGTNVASIIVGAKGYNRSVIGVAPEALLMPIKISTSAISITSDALIAGINYAISNNADIISMSVSTTSVNETLLDACQAAYDSGIILLASASNSAKSTTQSICYPAAFPCVIGVMAYGSDGQLCNFSNYDPSLKYYNIAAPGYMILGAYNDTTTINMCSAFSGTSQATPIVAGLAALYLSVYKDHTPEEFARSLYNSSTDTCTSNSTVVTNTTYTFPVPNAMNLLEYPNVQPVLYAISGSTAIVDDENSLVYGLEQNYSSLEDYIAVQDGTYEIIPTENGYGTGTIIRVKNNAGIDCRDYEIVIFGDTDGDSLCDGRDAALCAYIVSGGMVPDCISFASDVDFDDSVTETDTDIIVGCGTFTDFVTQIR